MERLRLRKDFERAFQNGKKFFCPLFSARIAPNDSLAVRLGVIVGKKVVKKAVARNRVRRRIREALRVLLKEASPARGLDIVVLPKISALDARFEELKKNLAKTITGK